MEYKCHCCNYITKKKYNFDKHILSNKHTLLESSLKSTQNQQLVNIESTQSQHITPTKISPVFACKYCEREFKFKQSMYRHIKYSCTKE